MDKPLIMLIDNGSVQPPATLNLRRLSGELGRASEHKIHPVSLQHVDRIATEQLDGVAAQRLETFLRERLSQGVRNYLAIPLFFGASRALTSYIPNLVETLQSEYGPFRLHLADVLYPLPQGEPRLAAILRDQIGPLISESVRPRVILVDHGSPQPSVTQVRQRIARELRKLLPSGARFDEAVMERREGSEYDFNGERLERVLSREARQSVDTPVILSLLFLSPGRHAGQGGDIATICSEAQQRFPGLEILVSPLVGEHPGLIEILRDRLESGLSAMQDA
jgi:sirohydrochlorin ferrochelatase